MFLAWNAVLISAAAAPCIGSQDMSLLESFPSIMYAYRLHAPGGHHLLHDTPCSQAES